MARLGIVAGGGGLPARLVAACRAQGRDVFVLGLKGQADPATIPPDVPQEWINLGEAGRGISLLKENGVGELVMAGGVRRPSLRELAPDWRTARFFARLGIRALGDDGLLRAVIDELEGEGFRIVGVDSILGGILAAEGVWGRHRPDAQATADIARGMIVAHALGALDVGQAVVVQGGIVLAVEAAEGTDALIRRCAGLQRAGSGAVLVKRAKPGQERRIDLPTIGPATVEACASCGFAGIAVEAGATLVVERDGAVARADEAGLFLCGVSPE